MSPLNRLLILEDDPKDLRLATDVARSLGVTQVDARVSLEQGLEYLKMGLANGRSLPEGILVDLNLGNDSGYEILRFCCTTPRLASIPVIVWSILGEEQRALCELFKVKAFVFKWDRPDALREALKSLQS